MVPLRRIPLSGQAADGDINAEIRFGIASWSKPDRIRYSIKYAWRDHRGHVCRGGEFPTGWALTEGYIMALESGQMGITNEQRRRLRDLLDVAPRLDVDAHENRDGILLHRTPGGNELRVHPEGSGPFRE